MATTKKTGIVEKVKAAVSGLFSKKTPGKSPTRAAAGKKAAVTRQAGESVAATKQAAGAAAEAVGTATKKAVARTPRKSSKKPGRRR